MPDSLLDALDQALASFDPARTEPTTDPLIDAMDAALSAYDPATDGPTAPMLPALPDTPQPSQAALSIDLPEPPAPPAPDPKEALGPAGQKALQAIQRQKELTAALEEKRQATRATIEAMTRPSPVAQLLKAAQPQASHQPNLFGSPELEAQIAEQMPDPPGVRLPENVARSSGAGVLRFNQAFWGLLRGAGDVLQFDSLSEFARSAGQQAQEMAAATRGEQRGIGPNEQAFYSGFESMGAMVPATAAGVVTGSPATTLSIMGAQTGGESYAHAREQGVETPQAVAYAVSQAAVEVATERIPVSRLLADLANRTGFMQSVMRQLAAELPGEQVATFFQDLNEWAAIEANQGKPFSAFVEERPSAAAQTAIATITATLGQSAGAFALDRLTRSAPAPMPSHDTSTRVSTPADEVGRLNLPTAEQNQPVTPAEGQLSQDIGVENFPGVEQTAGVEQTTASVPFMVTTRMEAELQALGYDQAAINAMTPADAQAILQTGRSAASPASPASPDPLIEQLDAAITSYTPAEPGSKPRIPTPTDMEPGDELQADVDAWPDDQLLGELTRAQGTVAFLEKQKHTSPEVLQQAKDNVEFWQAKLAERGIQEDDDTHPLDDEDDEDADDPELTEREREFEEQWAQVQQQLPTGKEFTVAGRRFRVKAWGDENDDDRHVVTVTDVSGRKPVDRGFWTERHFMEFLADTEQGTPGTPVPFEKYANAYFHIDQLEKDYMDLQDEAERGRPSKKRTQQIRDVHERLTERKKEAQEHFKVDQHYAALVPELEAKGIENLSDAELQRLEFGIQAQYRLAGQNGALYAGPRWKDARLNAIGNEQEIRDNEQREQFPPIKIDGLSPKPGTVFEHNGQHWAVMDGGVYHGAHGPYKYMRTGKAVRVVPKDEYTGEVGPYSYEEHEKTRDVHFGTFGSGISIETKEADFRADRVRGRNTGVVYGTKGQVWVATGETAMVIPSMVLGPGYIDGKKVKAQPEPNGERDRARAEGRKPTFPESAAAPPKNAPRDGKKPMTPKEAKAQEPPAEPEAPSLYEQHTENQRRGQETLKDAGPKRPLASKPTFVIHPDDADHNWDHATNRGISGPFWQLISTASIAEKSRVKGLVVGAGEQWVVMGGHGWIRAVPIEEWNGPSYTYNEHPHGMGYKGMRVGYRGDSYVMTGETAKIVHDVNAPRWKKGTPLVDAAAPDVRDFTTIEKYELAQTINTWMVAKGDNAYNHHGKKAWHAGTITDALNDGTFWQQLDALEVPADYVVSKIDAIVNARASKVDASHAAGQTTPRESGQAPERPLFDGDPPQRGDADGEGSFGPEGVGGSSQVRGFEPRPTETPAQHTERLYSYVLDDARAQSPRVREARIREYFDVAVEAAERYYDELAQSLQDDPRHPDVLLKAIHDAGGLHDDALVQPMSKRGKITTTRRMTGELRWIMDGLKFGRVGQYQIVRRPDRGEQSFRKQGRGWDGMLEALHQQPGFDHLETVSDLIDAVADAVRAVTFGDAQGTPDASKLKPEDLQAGGIYIGEPWWLDLAARDVEGWDVVLTDDIEERTGGTLLDREGRVAKVRLPDGTEQWFDLADDLDFTKPSSDADTFDPAEFEEQAPAADKPSLYAVDRNASRDDYIHTFHMTGYDGEPWPAVLKQRVFFTHPRDLSRDQIRILHDATGHTEKGREGQPTTLEVAYQSAGQAYYEPPQHGRQPKLDKYDRAWIRTALYELDQKDSLTDYEQAAYTHLEDVLEELAPKVEKPSVLRAAAGGLNLREATNARGRQQQEQKRRETQAPLLAAADVLPPLPTIEQYAADTRKRGEAWTQHMADRREADLKAVAESRQTLLDMGVPPAEIEQLEDHWRTTLPEGYLASVYADHIRALKAGKDPLADVNERAIPFKWFRSGVKRQLADFDALAENNLPIGVTATDMSGAITTRVVDYVKAGGEVFIDSGAFGTANPDFGKIIARYQELAARVGKDGAKRLTIVAPDKVGDQGGTLELLRTYQTQLRELIARGINVVIPAQQGERELVDLENRYFGMFGPDFVLGVAFNKAAWPSWQIGKAVNLSQRKKVRIHLLGAGERNFKVKNLREVGRAFKNELELSGDSNAIRAITGKGRAIDPEEHAAKVEDAGSNLVGSEPRFDDTEVIGYMRDFSDRELQQLADALNPVAHNPEVPWTPAGIKEAVKQGTFWLTLEDVPYGEDIVFREVDRIIKARTEKAAAPGVRKDAVKEATAPKTEPRLLPVPDGWTLVVGRTRTKEGHTFEAEVDWQHSRIVFSEQKHLENPEIRNHEIAHVIMERLLPEAQANALLKEYVAYRDLDEWTVTNHFHRERIVMDLGPYFTFPDRVEPELRALFDKYVGQFQATGAAPKTAPKVDPNAPSVTVNTARRSVEVKFPAKPSDAIREKLKARGYRWAKTNGHWYRTIPGAGSSRFDTENMNAEAAAVRELLGVGTETSRAPEAPKAATGPRTTPGTRRHWSNGSEWAEHLRDLVARSGTKSKIDTDITSHMAALDTEFIRAQHKGHLRTIKLAIERSEHRVRPPKGSRAGTDYERIINEVNNALQRSADVVSREDVIDRIVAAARREDYEPVEAKEVKGTDGKWYRTGVSSMPWGVSAAKPEEYRSIGWVRRHKRDNTTHGERFESREKLVANMREAQEKRDAEFRNDLQQMSNAKLASQADHWLKETVKVEGSEPSAEDAYRAAYSTWLKAGGVVQGNVEPARADYDLTYQQAARIRQSVIAESGPDAEKAAGYAPAPRRPEPAKELTPAEKLAQKVMARLAAEQGEPSDNNAIVSGNNPEQPREWKVGDRVDVEEGPGEILFVRDESVKIRLDAGGRLSNWIPKSRLFPERDVSDALREFDRPDLSRPRPGAESLGNTRPVGGGIGERSRGVAAPTTVSFKAEVSDGSGFSSNALRFPTREDAEAYASELMGRWIGARDSRVVESTDPVTHRWDKAQYKHVPVEAAAAPPAAADPNADLDARRAENAKKREELFKKLRGNKLTANVDPEDVVTMAEILLTYVDDGITEFRRAWRLFKEEAPDLAGRMRRPFELAWEELRGEAVSIEEFEDDGRDPAPKLHQESADSTSRNTEIPHQPTRKGLKWSTLHAVYNDLFRKKLTEWPTDARSARELAEKLAGRSVNDHIDEVTDGIEGALNVHYRREVTGRGDHAADWIMAGVAIETHMPRGWRSLEKMDLQQFSTPLPIAGAAQWLAQEAAGEHGTILEPTAGTGNLISSVGGSRVTAVELSDRRAEVLRLAGFTVREADYLKLLDLKDQFDVIVTNPPWGKYSTGKYGGAVALGFNPVDVAERFIAKNVRDLKAGGRLVAVMPTTMLRSPEFRHFLNKHGKLRAIIQSPPGAYDSRATTVDSLLLVWDKGATDDSQTLIAVGNSSRGVPKDWAEYADLVARIPARTTEGSRVSTKAGEDDAAGRRPEPPAAPTPGTVGGGSGVARPAGQQPRPAAPVGAPVVPGGRNPGVVADPTGRERRELDGPGTTPGAARTPQGDTTRGLSGDALESFRKAESSQHFAPYRLRSQLRGVRHPKLVVEARALSGVPYPELTLEPTARFTRIVESGRVSIEQAEQALAAVQANVTGRHGYLAADNVGVGKSREIALTILDLMERAKAEKRELRLMVTTFNRDTMAGLIDAEMLQEVLAGEDPGFEIVKVPDLKAAKKDGAEYEPLPRYPHAIYVIDSYNLREYRQALLDVNLHGVIGDEVHTYKNADAAVGATWQTIHGRIMMGIPRAHQAFAYFTATPAQSVYDYRYLYGLREWPIDGFNKWIDVVTGNATEENAKELQAATEAGARNPDRVMSNVGIEVVGGDSEDTEKGERPGRGIGIENIFAQKLSPAEAEQIPREWKVKGKFSSRDLWREGTEFVVETRELKPQHKARYDKFAQLARDVYDAHKAFGALDKSGKRNTYGPTGALQFAAKRIQMQPAIEEAIEIAKAHVAQGYQAVLSVINVKEMDAQGGNIRAAIEQINTRQVDQTDDGELIDMGEIPEAIIRKAELLEQAAELGVLDNPIELVAKAFGAHRVANIIGGAGKNRALHAKEFQEGKRDVAIISAAGTTGINLDHRVHTGKGVGGRRVFIDVQYEWSATKAVQRYGRVDRTSNITPPKIVALNFGSASEKKFLATVANRMSSLGALSKGGAESTGASALEEFEITGQDALIAAQNAWDKLPDEDKELWKGRKFRDPGNPEFVAPHTDADMRQIQLALLWLPLDKANAFWESFIEERARVREAMGFLDERRAKRYRGEVLRSVELGPQRTIHQVKNENGERFGILSGVVMPEMPKIAPHLRTPDGPARRRYITFTAQDGTIVAGLEVPWMRVKSVARLYGALLGGEKLDTPEKVREALAAGEKLPLVQEGWYLRQRKDGRIQIDGAKMADRALLQKHGAGFSAVGTWWGVVDLAKFLDRFPVKGGDVEVEVTDENPDDDDRADNRSAGGGTGGGRADSRGAPGRQTDVPVRSGRLPADVERGGEVMRRDEGEPDNTVRPVEFPELVELARELINTPRVVKAFRTPGKLGEFSPHGIRLHSGLFRRGQEQELAKALAHEIGHLVDWLPDETLKRGNLLGRLRSLHRYLKHTFTTPNGVEIKNEDIKAELQALSDYWRPWDPSKVSASFANYRRSSKELYADAISVLMVSPGLLQKRAPTFYTQFFEGLDTKPEVKRAYFDLQDVLSGTPEEIIARRRERVIGMFEAGDTKALDLERLRQAEKKGALSDFWRRLRIEHVDKNTPFITRVKEAGEIPPHEDPRFLLSERNYIGGKVKSFIERHIQPIYERLNEAEISWHVFSEALFYERVNSGDRIQIANPLGVGPKEAAEQHRNLMLSLSAEQKRVINHAIEQFRRAMGSVLDDAYRAELYRKDQYEEMKANPAYATYRVLDHLDAGASSRIFHQVGTLKDVLNVADATILKAIVTIQATEHNKVKLGAFRFLDRHFPGDAERAPKAWNGRSQSPKEPKKGDKRELVRYFEQGHLEGRYVDSYIADSLNNRTVEAATIIRGMSLLNNEWFRPVFTGLNIGFQTFNIYRDFFRSWKAIPGMTLGRMLKRYRQGATLARVRAFGLPENPTSEQAQAHEDLMQAEKVGILALTYNDMIRGGRTEESQIEETLAKQGVGGYGSPTPSNHRTRRMVQELGEFIRNAGNFVETLPKAAGMYEFKGEGRVDEIPADRRAFIRERIGTPDILAGGTRTSETNNLFLFSNVIIQGIRADYKTATEPATRAGFWWKTVALNVVPKVLMFAAIMAARGAGDDEEDNWLQSVGKLLQNVSEYDLTNYTIIPFGMTDQGELAHVRVPQDDTGRLIGGLVWKGLQMLRGDRDVLGAVVSVVEYAFGQSPSLTPSIGVIRDTTDVIAGRNAYDDYRNRFLFTDDEYAAGFTMDNVQKFLRYEFDQVGLGAVTTWAVGDTRRHQERTLLHYVVEAPVIGRWVKLSNYGKVEEFRRVRDRVAKDEARLRLAERKAVSTAVRELIRTPAGERNVNDRAHAIVRELYPDASAEDRRDQYRDIRKRLRMGLALGEADPLTESVLSARSNAQRVAILKRAAETMSESEFRMWMTRARQQDVISADVRSEVMRAQ